MKRFQASAVLKIISFLCLVIVVISFAASGTNDTDVAQYLASGKYIVEHQIIPAANIFSYPNANYRMVWDEWLFHVMVYEIYSIAGFAGLAIFQTAIIFSVFTLLYLAMRSRVRLTVALPVLIVTALVAYERFILRADALSLLFIALYFYILKKYETKQSRLIYPHTCKIGVGVYFLPLLQLIWVNFHGFWILGLIIISIFLFVEIISAARDFFIKKNKEPLVYSRLKILAVILFASVAVCFINPYGLAGVKVPFQRLVELKTTHQILLDVNADFYGPFSHTSETNHLSVAAYKALIILSLVILLLQIKKISLRDALLYAAFLLMSFNFIRNIPMFAVAVAFILPPILDDWVDQRQRQLPQKIIFTPEIISMAVLAITIIISIFLSYALITNKFYRGEGRTRRFGLSLNSFIFPEKATRFVKAVNLGGNVFNDYNIGAYVNWALYPERPSFIDGRTNSYDVSFLKNYFNFMAGLEPYQKLVDQYDINYFFLNHKSNDTKVIIKKLYNDLGWRLIYFDEQSVIFVKNVSRNKFLIDKYAIDFKTGKNFNPLKIDLAKEDDLFVARNLRGEFFLNLDLLDKAYNEFQAAWTIQADNAATDNNLGVIEQRRGNIPAARKFFEQAVKLNNNFAPVHFNLGNIYSKLNLWEEARQEYETAIRLDSTTPDAYLNLGVIYQYHLDNSDQAVYFWKKYLKLNPAGPAANDIINELRRLNAN